MTQDRLPSAEGALIQESLPDGTFFVPGDQNGLLAINPDTFVHDYSKGFEDYLQANGLDPVQCEDEVKRTNKEAETALPWLSKWNGKLPNAYQNTRVIIGLLDNRGSRLSDTEKEALAEHPNPTIRSFLAQNQIIVPQLLETIFSFGDLSMDQLPFSVSMQLDLITGTRLSNGMYMSDIRYGKTLLHAYEVLSHKLQREKAS